MPDLCDSPGLKGQGVVPEAVQLGHSGGAAVALREQRDGAAVDAAVDLTQW